MKKRTVLHQNRVEQHRLIPSPIVPLFGFPGRSTPVDPSYLKEKRKEEEVNVFFLPAICRRGTTGGRGPCLARLRLDGE